MPSTEFIKTEYLCKADFVELSGRSTLGLSFAFTPGCYPQSSRIAVEAGGSSYVSASSCKSVVY
jgi:hypothetical protein